MTYTTIGPPWWDDKPVMLIGGGPSLRGVDFKRFASIDWHVCGVNQSIFDAPCEAGISMDFAFVEHRQVALSEVARAHFDVYLTVTQGSIELMEVVRGAKIIRRENRCGLSESVEYLCSNSTSGFAALNLAVAKRAKRIYLFGYDYGWDGDKSHYHAAHLRTPRDPSFWRLWKQAYDHVAPRLKELGIVVINASPTSSVGCFEKMTIEEGLADAATALHRDSSLGQRVCQAGNAIHDTGDDRVALDQPV